MDDWFCVVYNTLRSLPFNQDSWVIAIVLRGDLNWRQPGCPALPVTQRVLPPPPTQTKLKQLHYETMSDDADYAIEQADAGASATIPMEAGQIKKGG